MYAMVSVRNETASIGPLKRPEVVTYVLVGTYDGTGLPDSLDVCQVYLAGSRTFWSTDITDAEYEKGEEFPPGPAGTAVPVTRLVR